MNKCFIVVIITVLVGCNGAARKHGVQPECRCELQIPPVPTMITTPEDRAEFLVVHYWDNYNFKDTACVNNLKVTEPAMAGYIGILLNAPLPEAHRSLRELLNRAQQDTAVYRTFIGMVEKYLDDPNSPLRNEDLYIPVLEHMIASNVLDSMEKLRPQSRMEIIVQNRVGHKANNFSYTLLSGANGNLYSIKTDYTLLFFNNPDCQMCAQVCTELCASPSVSKMIGQQRLTVLAIYPDQDLKAWRNHGSQFPVTWIYAHDKQLSMRNQKLYDLRAIPTLYLLDRNKTVLIKDFVSVAQLEQYFESASGKI